jgi:lipoyl-dependent peroxiredoxin
MKSKGSAVWKGNLRDGNGIFLTESGAIHKAPFNFLSRFEGQPGSTPEELIAAAHAGCFSMALSAELAKLHLTADSIETTCVIEMEMLDKGPTITKSHLELRAKVPGAGKDIFLKAAETAKANCPVSRLLNAAISLEATLLP